MKARRLTVCLSIWLATSVATAAPRYTVSKIITGDAREAYWTVDMNGDQRDDLVLAVWSEDRGRELAVHLQDSDGKFPAIATRRIELKKDILAFAFADVRGEPGYELLLFTRSAAFALSTRTEGYANNIKKLFDWTLPASASGKKSVGFLGKASDLTGDAVPDLLLPGIKAYSLLRGESTAGEVSFAIVSTLPIAQRFAMRPRDGETSFDFSGGGVDLTMHFTPSSAFTGLIREPFPSRIAATDPKSTAGVTLLNHAQWIAAVATAKLNSDGLADFVYLDYPDPKDDTKRRVNIFYQGTNNRLNQNADWQQELTMHGGASLVDVDADGVDDLVFVDSRESASTKVFIYRNQLGKFTFDQPSYLGKFSGFDVKVRFVDLDGDKRPELLVSSSSVTTNTELAPGMKRSLLIYAGLANRATTNSDFYGPSPTAKYEEQFFAAEFKGLLNNWVLDADVDGDGKRELLASDKTGALVARKYGAKFAVEAEPVWKYSADEPVFSTSVHLVNQDTASDFVLEQERALTLLVSRP